MHKSLAIRKRTTQNIFNAYDYAEWKGTPMNLFVTIHLKDRVSKSSYTAFTEIMQKFRRWLGYCSQKMGVSLDPSYVFAHENPNNNPHVHLAFHIPEQMIPEFQTKIPRWVEKVQGPNEPTTIHTIGINPHAYKAVANYIVKGTDAEFIELFNLSGYSWCGPQGVIYGQRAGFSRNLGPEAIKRAGATDGYNSTEYRKQRKKKYELIYSDT